MVSVPQHREGPMLAAYHSAERFMDQAHAWTPLDTLSSFFLECIIRTAWWVCEGCVDILYWFITELPRFGELVVWRSHLGTWVAQHLRIMVLGYFRLPYCGRKSAVPWEFELGVAPLTGGRLHPQLAHCWGTRRRAGVTWVHFLWDYVGKLTVFL